MPVILSEKIKKTMAEPSRTTCCFCGAVISTSRLSIFQGVRSDIGKGTKGGFRAVRLQCPPPIMTRAQYENTGT